jgi:MFS transporter, YNFM family, putative membrane transport protein
VPSPSSPEKTPTRAIALLALAAFAAQAMVRVTDSLLPQIAADVGTSLGAASIVVTAYGITHGSVQLIVGPVGDRVGKYRTITIATGLCAIVVALCGLAPTLTLLALARLASGACAAWIIPLSLAFIGDVTPYARRQQVIGRYLSGQILGQLFGQAAGGILGDLVGWRGVFFLLAGIFALATAALVRELAVNPVTRITGAEGSSRGLVADYRTVLGNPWARVVILAVFLEGMLSFGVFTFVGADLHLRFGLSFTLVGATVASFAIGGLIYALSVNWLVARVGQTGLAATGGLMMAVAFLWLALEPRWWLAPPAVTAVGLGFYMLHNTLQTHATQMAPKVRGTAVSIFASSFYIGQTIGVAMAALVVDRFGARFAFAGAAILWPVLTLWFIVRLRRHMQVGATPDGMHRQGQ